MSPLLSTDSDSGAAPVLAPRPPIPQRPMRLCSRVQGRERWHVKRLENRPRLAAAVEMVLQTEPGIVEARVNPLTGRVLVRYDPAIVAEPIKAVLGRALAVSPLSDDDFQLFRPKPAGAHNHLLAAEVACGLLHVVLMGGFCPLGLISAAALFFGQRARCSRRSLSVPLDCSESAAKN
jgi:hypothetical protein